MPEFKDLEKANAAYAELEGKHSSLGEEVGSLARQVEKLNSENASRRKTAEDLEKQLETQRRDGESEAKKAVRAELLEEATADKAAAVEPLEKEIAELKTGLRRQTLEAAAAKAGFTAEHVERAIVQAEGLKLLPEDLGKPEAVLAAFKEVGKQSPNWLAASVGGPSDTPGSRGKGRAGAGEEEVKSLRELLHDKETGKPTPERAERFRQEHPEKYAELRAQAREKPGFHGGDVFKAPAAAGDKDGTK